MEHVIREVYELFMEMSALVAQQEDFITNISQNMENANVAVNGGKEKLHSAKKHKKSARKMKIVFVTGLIAVVVIVIIGVVFAFV